MSSFSTFSVFDTYGFDVVRYNPCEANEISRVLWQAADKNVASLRLATLLLFTSDFSWHLNAFYFLDYTESLLCQIFYVETSSNFTSSPAIILYPPLSIVILRKLLTLEPKFLHMIKDQNTKKIILVNWRGNHTSSYITCPRPVITQS